MSKSIKLKNNSYIDSSSISYKRRNLNEVLIDHFQIPSTRGEVRYSKIAELTTDIGSGRIGLTMLIVGIGDIASVGGVCLLVCGRPNENDFSTNVLISWAHASIGLVHNQSTGLSEIWLKSNAWNLPIDIYILNKDTYYGTFIINTGYLKYQNIEPINIKYIVSY